MFEEDNNIESEIRDSDFLMKSILSQAQEEVPEHVWEGISAGLDSIDAAKARKHAVIRFIRPAAAVAAAAVAVGLLLNHGGNGSLVPESTDGDMIAVAAPEHQETQEINEFETFESATKTYIAEAYIPEDHNRKEYSQENDSPITETQDVDLTQTPETEKAEETAEADQQDFFQEIWPEDEPADGRKTRTAIVLSGMAGTNNAQGNSATGPLRRPSISSAPLKTGIRQTSTESTYGLPISLGIGAKIGLSPRWSIGVGVDYTLLTRKFYGTYTYVNAEGIAEKTISSDIRNSQQYIGIPVNAYYNILDRNHINFYAYAGGTVERCISDKYELINTDIIHKEAAKGVQLSAGIGLGVEFLLGKHLGLYIDPSLRYYFDNGQPKSIRTVQPLMLGFEMGLRVNL